MPISGVSAGVDTSLLKSILGFTSGTFPIPTVCAISLHTAILGTAKVFANEWTQTSTNYVRLSAGVDTANWLIAAFVANTGSVGSNKIQLAMAAASGAGFPLNILSVGFNDSLTYGGGNLDWFADVASTQVNAGIIVQFNVGDITLATL
jgi:hypothetical protein